jgi:dienelactone hydrolase
MLSRMSPRLALLSFALAALLAARASSSSQGEAAVRFELASDDVLVDEPIAIAVSGLAPRSTVTVRLRGGPGDRMASNATFTADANGRIDLTRMAPAKGSYKEVDSMGLFWSVEREGAPAPDEAIDDAAPSPERWTLTAEVANAVVAKTSVRRRAIAADLRVRPVREAGLVGTFFEPSDGGRHPAFLVLSGSGGGIPPAIGPAGGLASRGYAVLALAYFGVDPLPRVLSNIPLEYFGNAFRWLAAQPSVDRTRLGVVGASRGGELALLLGSIYPDIHAVVAYMPSNVVWRGCCDMTTQVAWTIGGRPVAAMPPPGRRNPIDTARAEIQVERIRGAILLVAGKDDGVWDSAPMAEKIVDRLKRNNFSFPYQSLTYDQTGHAITRPYTSTMELNSRRHPLTGRTMHLGGTPSGTAKAREDSWRQLLAFVDRYLKDARP